MKTIKSALTELKVKGVLIVNNGDANRFFEYIISEEPLAKFTISVNSDFGETTFKLL